MFDIENHREEQESGPIGETDPRAELVARVAASRLLSKAPKLRQFLLYIAKHSFSGRLDLVTEYHIGVKVFERKDSYSPGEDNIVRSYARTLRKRLEEYFASDGADEEYVLEIPRGGYALEFKRRDVLVPAVPADLPKPPQSEVLEQPIAADSKADRPERNTHRWWFPVIGATVVLVFSVIGSYRLGKRNAESHQSTPSIHRFWESALGKRDTLIVPSDTGLTLVLGLIQDDVTVQEYVTNQHLKTLATQFPQLEGWDRPISHRYTDLVDVLALHQLDRTPEVGAVRPGIRYARDLKVDELGKGNAILLGGSNSNPWVKLFDANLNFHLHFLPKERTFRIENRNPLPGEPSEYPYHTGPAQPYAYGLMAIVPNLSETGNVLLLEGVTNSGLQAAVSLLNDESLMTMVAEKSIRPDGSMRPAEFLVRTAGVGGDSTGVEIVGFRVKQ